MKTRPTLINCIHRIKAQLKLIWEKLIGSLRFELRIPTVPLDNPFEDFEPNFILDDSILRFPELNSIILPHHGIILFFLLGFTVLMISGRETFDPGQSRDLRHHLYISRG
jgi:hypothetical protein